MTKKNLIKVGMMVSYDYKLLKISLPLIYKHSDVIVLALDINQKTWSGSFFDIDETFFEWVHTFDIDNKIRIYRDVFYLEGNTAKENELRQRKLTNLELNAGWVIQIDADEYFLNFEKVVALIEKYDHAIKLNGTDLVVNIYGKWITLFKKVNYGYLYIDNSESFPFITNDGSRYVEGRSVNADIIINTDIIAIHQSWARSEEEVLMKLENWGHKADLGTSQFFSFWNNVNYDNYFKFKNFHPLGDGKIWKKLNFFLSSNVNQFIREFERQKCVDIKDTNNVAVVIPIYKLYSELTSYEHTSLCQCFKLLANHSIVLVHPLWLDTIEYKAAFAEYDIQDEGFDDHFFQNILGYNELMLDCMFYFRFLSFEYILIYQLDAMIFDDQLKYWCERGYDYIGAPWLTDKFTGNLIEASYKKWKSRRSYKKNLKESNSNLPVSEQFYNQVGNGGFSLRRVDKFFSIILEMKENVLYYLENAEHYYFNEDVFWSLEVNRDKKRLKIPDYKTAVKFSIEFLPDSAFKLTRGRFPFGCHDWESYLSFWGPKFLEKGIQY